MSHTGFWSWNSGGCSLWWKLHSHNSSQHALHLLNKDFNHFYTFCLEVILVLHSHNRFFWNVYNAWWRQKAQKTKLLAPATNKHCRELHCWAGSFLVCVTRDALGWIYWLMSDDPYLPTEDRVQPQLRGVCDESAHNTSNLIGFMCFIYTWKKFSMMLRLSLWDWGILMPQFHKPSRQSNQNLHKR